MGHAGATRKSPNDSSRETLSQKDSVGQIVHDFWQLFYHRDTKLLGDLKLLSMAILLQESPKVSFSSTLVLNHN